MIERDRAVAAPYLIRGLVREAKALAEEAVESLTVSSEDRIAINAALIGLLRAESHLDRRIRQRQEVAHVQLD